MRAICRGDHGSQCPETGWRARGLPKQSHKLHRKNEVAAASTFLKTRRNRPCVTGVSAGPDACSTADAAEMPAAGRCGLGPEAMRRAAVQLLPLAPRRVELGPLSRGDGDAFHLCCHAEPPPEICPPRPWRATGPPGPQWRGSEPAPVEALRSLPWQPPARAGVALHGPTLQRRPSGVGAVELRHVHQLREEVRSLCQDGQSHSECLAAPCKNYLQGTAKRPPPAKPTSKPRYMME